MLSEYPRIKYFAAGALYANSVGQKDKSLIIADKFSPPNNCDKLEQDLSRWTLDEMFNFGYDSDEGVTDERLPIELYEWLEQEMY